MADLTVWHGDDEDLARLADAIARHCTCQANEMTCSAHDLLNKQRALDGLAFVGRMRARFTKDDAAA